MFEFESQSANFQIPLYLFLPEGSKLKLLALAALANICIYVVFLRATASHAPRTDPSKVGPCTNQILHHRTVHNIMHHLCKTASSNSNSFCITYLTMKVATTPSEILKFFTKRRNFLLQ